MDGGQDLGEIAKVQGKGIIDCLCDLTIEENLDTEWLHGENNVDDNAVAQILTYPNAVIGLSDGGAHVQFQSGFGFSTRLLSEWVREKQVMTLEHAVRRLTFDSASALGIHDRGLLRPGLAADIVVFDPATIRSNATYDEPRQFPEGIDHVIVNGTLVVRDGEHTGATPGRAIRLGID